MHINKKCLKNKCINLGLYLNKNNIKIAFVLIIGLKFGNLWFHLIFGCCDLDFMVLSVILLWWFKFRLCKI